MFKIYSPNNITIPEGKTTEEAILIAAKYKLNKLFEENKDSKILFLTSAGSAFKLLEDFNNEYLSQNLTIAVLDERADADESINNFLQLKETEFYHNAKNKGCYFIETNLEETETPESLAERFENSLRNWKQKNPNGIVIGTLGMGPDGHTSGVMPFPEDKDFFDKAFVNTEKWVVSYDAKDKNPYRYRVTTTLSFLKNEIDYSIAYISGENKSEAFKRVLDENGGYAETPARIMREMDIQVFTDIEV